MLKLNYRVNNNNNTLGNLLANHISLYPTPVSLNYSYSFGSLIGFFFVLQIITGIILAMHYIPHVDFAFASIINFTHNSDTGWLIRYMHANGASMLFILMYLHIGRGLLYRSFLHNRKYLWWTGVVIFLLMMITAFIGYVLPWGQMSLWGATVITSLVTAIPFIGKAIAHWIWGGFAITNVTLIRFYSLHYLLPFITAAVIIAHLALLHDVGSTNPTGLSQTDFTPFYPYYVYKDLFALLCALLVFTVLVFFYPNYLGHPDNYIKANPLVTPKHIVPEWYFTPFYAILRACPNKLGGVIGMLLSILVLLVVPKYPIPAYSLPGLNSTLHKTFFWLFVSVFLFLMKLGGKPAQEPYVMLSKIYTLLYFSYFLIILPAIPYLEQLSLKELLTNPDSDSDVKLENNNSVGAYKNRIKNIGKIISNKLLDFFSSFKYTSIIITYFKTSTREDLRVDWICFWALAQPWIGSVIIIWTITYFELLKPPV